MTEDEMVGWHNQLSGHEFEQTLCRDAHNAITALMILTEERGSQLWTWKPTNQRKNRVTEDAAMWGFM